MNIGSTYKIWHTRKGCFVFRPTHQDDTWITGEIVAGRAAAMLDHNVRTEGEEITIRLSHITKSVEVQP